MKQYFILAAAALVAMCACTKNEVNVLNREVSFQVVNKVGQTKAPESSAFTYDSFGVYAWSEGTQGLFMDNETVSKHQDGKWMPSTTYYWPKNDVRFVCYYPREDADSYITVTEDKITYKDIDIAGQQVDLLFADKTVFNGTPTSEAGARDVPVIFHHALSQINIQVKLAYASKVNYNADGTVKDNYRWEVEITDAKLVNLKHEGTLELVMDNEAAQPEGTYAWTLPANMVWTPSDDKISLDCGAPGLLTVKKAVNLVSNYYILPQELDDQAIEFTFNIRTYRGIGDAKPLLFLNEKGIKKTGKFSVAASIIPTWKINQSTTYIIMLAPTAGSGADPEDPTKPIDPNDPGLKDVEILFDPAVAGWTTEIAGVGMAL